MRALTLRQPWAWTVEEAGKRVENRTWRPPEWMLGERLAIHAGKAFDRCVAIELDAGQEFVRDCLGGDAPRVPSKDAIALGAVVAVCTLRGAVYCPGGEFRCNVRVTDDDVLVVGDVSSDEAQAALASRWCHGPWGWLLGDVRALSEPVPCRGAQGLWRLGDDDARRVLSLVERGERSGC